MANLMEVLKRMSFNDEQEGTTDQFAQSALQQRFQPNMQDAATGIFNTSQAFARPDLYKDEPMNARMAANKRMTTELAPMVAGLELQKASREVNAPYSDYGKIAEDLRSGRITPEMAQMAFSKGSLDEQLKRAQIAALTAKTTNAGNNTPMTRALAQKDAATLTNYTDAGNAATALVDNARQFESYRKDMNFGGPVGGLLPSFSDAAQQADSLNSTMATNITSLMKGSQSDRELAMALRSVPSGRMGQDAVAGTVKKYEAAAAVTQTKQTFMDQYIQSHGNLRGAEQLWQQFRQQNPIMDAATGQLRDDVSNIYNPIQDFSSIIGGGSMSSGLDDIDENDILQELQNRGVQ